MLTNKKELAKISRAPGKTQLINHFNVISANKKEWYLVDLPGYGFAKVSQAQRKTWERMIADYIRKRENLGILFVLIDSRLTPQKIDLDFVNQLGEWQVPFAIVFTKADKITQREVAANVKLFMNKLREQWEYLPAQFVTSAEKRLGSRQLLQYIQELNEAYFLRKS